MRENKKDNNDATADKIGRKWPTALQPSIVALYGAALWGIGKASEYGPHIVPRLIRWHMADVGFALLNTFLAAEIASQTPDRKRRPLLGAAVVMLGTAAWETVQVKPGTPFDTGDMVAYALGATMYVAASKAESYFNKTRSAPALQPE